MYVANSTAAINIFLKGSAIHMLIKERKWNPKCSVKYRDGKKEGQIKKTQKTNEINRKPSQTWCILIQLYQ